MKFATIEEKRAYYRAAIAKYRAKRKAQGLLAYEPETVPDPRPEALRMHKEGINPLIIWSALDIPKKELADILQTRITPEQQYAFFS